MTASGAVQCVMQQHQDSRLGGELPVVLNDRQNRGGERESHSYRSNTKHCGAAPQQRVYLGLRLIWAGLPAAKRVLRIKGKVDKGATAIGNGWEGRKIVGKRHEFVRRACRCDRRRGGGQGLGG